MELVMVVDGETVSYDIRLQTIYRSRPIETNHYQSENSCNYFANHLVCPGDLSPHFKYDFNFIVETKMALHYVQLDNGKKAMRQLELKLKLNVAILTY